MNTAYEEYEFAVTRCFHREKKRELLERFGTPQEFIGEKDDRIVEAGIIDKNELMSFRQEYSSPRTKENYRSFFADQLNGITFLYDGDFPEQLKHVSNPPVALFIRGSLPEPGEKLVAMVGARRCSDYGRLMSEKIAGDLAENGFSVVSGMALGVDGYSHRGCLAHGGRTYAFLGCGTDICYPPSNRDIYEQIPYHGALISEFPRGMAPTKQSFPDRNRLISGMSGAVLVIEARERSGSLITADMALDQGKDVYALPGRITDPLSAGANRLIWQGAGIIRSSEAIVAQLKMEDASFEMNDLEEEMKKLNLEKDEMVVYSCFDFCAKSIDEVQKVTGMTLLELLNVVVNLCNKGYLKEVFMNHYVRNVPV